MRYPIKMCKDVFMVEYEGEVSMFGSYEKAYEYAKSAYLPDIKRKLLQTGLNSLHTQYFVCEQSIENMLQSLIKIPLTRQNKEHSYVGAKELPSAGLGKS